MHSANPFLRSHQSSRERGTADDTSPILLWEGKETSGTPRTCKGLFSAYTQALRDRDLPEEDMKQMGLSGAT